MATSTIKQPNATEVTIHHTISGPALPNNIKEGVSFDVYTASALGITSGDYFNLMTIKGWSDTSIPVQQIAFGDYKIFWRRSSGNTWTNWVQVATT